MCRYCTGGRNSSTGAIPAASHISRNLELGRVRTQTQTSQGDLMPCIKPLPFEPYYQVSNTYGGCELDLLLQLILYRSVASIQESSRCLQCYFGFHHMIMRSENAISISQIFHGNKPFSNNTSVVPSPREDLHINQPGADKKVGNNNSRCNLHPGSSRLSPGSS